MEKLVREIQKENKIVAVYASKEEPSRFLVGKINLVEPNGCIIELYDPDGIKDGFVFLYIDDIYQIEIESIYLQKLEKIMKVYAAINVLNVKENRYRPFIDDILSNKKNLFTIKMYFDDSLTGYIVDMQEEIIEIAVIKDDGFSDGKMYIKKENIERVYWNNKEHMKILS